MARGRLILLIAAGALLLGGLTWALWPDPIPVDIAEVGRGPMQTTVTGEGVTRVREPYLVTAPRSGTARRSPVDVGDQVVGGETVVAVIEPAEPALLDARGRAVAEAALREAEAAVHAGAANVARAEADLAHAVSELERNRALAARGTIAQRLLEDSQQRVETARAGLQAAQSELAMREATRARAEAELRGTAAQGDAGVEVVAPETGTVLAVENLSARLVQAGEPLLTIGDLDDLEIVVDLLSADAVRVVPDAPATVERWGGPGVLEARVDRIDPRGFRRVSALGIEEQRVNVYLDILTPQKERARLGDAFRVFVRIVTWEDDDALQVPIAALFRSHGEWAVYRIEGGRAHTRTITLGQRTDTMAQVLDGLDAGDQVVAFPGDRVTDGARVRDRAAR